MITPDLISYYFKMNHRVIQMQLEGLSHEDTLLEPPFRANSFNWIIGHIITGRDTALKMLDQEPVWSQAESALYERESEPISAEKALPLQKLVADLNLTQERLAAALARLTAEELERDSNGRTLGERLAFAYWHEAYHAGQTELLRQLTGIDDKII